MSIGNKDKSNGSGSVLGKSLGFSLMLALLFTLVANLLPQVQGEAPVEKEVDLGALTNESFAALGEEIFKGKGTCTLCHNALGRAPDILALNMVQAAGERLKDIRYKGKAKTAEEYFRESMREPNAYVVAGFGKKGSNDTESPMPVVPNPPIQLSEVEMDAVIAFMQSKDGNEITVALPTEAPAAPSSGGEAVAAAAAATPEEAIASYGCQACHVVGGSGGELGPDLSKVGARLSAEKIRQSIMNPDAVTAKGYPTGMMPQDFAEKMTAKEMEMLVKYLAVQK